MPGHGARGDVPSQAGTQDHIRPVLGDGCKQVRYLARVVGAIGIHEDDDLALSMGHTSGAGAAITGMGFMDDTRALRFGDRNRAVVGAAIDEDDLKEPIFIDGAQDMGKAVFFVEGGDDEGCVHGEW